MRNIVQKLFVKGVSRLLSRSLADDQTAIRVRGCIQPEIGRYAPIWEGESVDSVGGVDSEFVALSTITTETVLAQLGGELLAWWDFSDPSNASLTNMTAGEYDVLLDQSGNGNDLTYQSGSRWEVQSIGNLSAAYLQESESSNYTTGAISDLDSLTSGYGVFMVANRQAKTAQVAGLVSSTWGAPDGVPVDLRTDAAGDLELFTRYDDFTDSNISASPTTNSGSLTWRPTNETVAGGLCYMLDITGPQLYFAEYTPNPAATWTVTGLVENTSVEVHNEAPNAVSSYIANDGTKFYVLDNSATPKIHEYSNNTAWDIESYSYSNVSFELVAAAIPRDMTFSNDGLKFWYNQGNVIYEGSNNTAWDLGSASDSGVTLNTSSRATNPAVAISDDGTELYVAGGSGDVHIYDLPTPYSLSGATYSSRVMRQTRQSNIDGLSFRTEGTRLWVRGRSPNRVHQYDTDLNVEDSYDVDTHLPENSGAEIFGFLMESGVTSFDVRVFKDNEEVATGAIQTTIDIESIPHSQIRMGIARDSTDEVDIYLGEVMILKGTLSDRRIAEIMLYLNNKWNITNNDPFDNQTITIKAPWRVEYFSSAGRLVSTSKSGIGNVAGSTTACFRGGDGITEMHEYSDYLFFFNKDAPIYAIHSSNITHNESSLGDGATGVPWSDVAAAFSVTGKGIYLSHEYYDTGTFELTSGATAVVGNSTAMEGSSGWHGSGTTYTAGVGHIQFAPARDDMPGRALPTRGYFFETSGANDIVLMDAADSNLSTTKYRAAVPGQWAQGRLPFTYRGRLCYIEGRTHILSNLLDGTGKGVSSVGADYIQIGAALSDVAVGDEVIIDASTNPDPIMFETSTSETFTILGVRTVGSDTRIYVDGAPSGGKVNWWVRRKLSQREQRQIWFTGRPADATRNIDTVEDFDPFFIHPSNFDDTWGDDIYGEPTAVVVIGDARVILSQAGALYQLVGRLPLDGVSPPGYGISVLRTGVGIRNDACWCFGEDREKVYFNSSVNDRMYVLLGSTATQIDEQVKDDPNYSGIFSHVVNSDDRVICLDTESSVAPVMWIYHTDKQAWDGYSVRVSPGQDQTGTLPAVQPGLGTVGTYALSTAYVVDDMILDDNGRIQVCTTAGTSNATANPTWGTTNGAVISDSGVSWTCYTTNPLYDTRTDGHGGIFTPFNDSAEVDRALVAYRNADDTFSLRTLAHLPDQHNNAVLLHSGSITPSSISAGGYPISGREVELTEYRRLSDNNGGDYNRRKVAIDASEGEDTGGHYRDPRWVDTENETLRQRFPIQGTRGSSSFAIKYGDDISPVGDVELIEVMTHVKRRR